MKRCLQLIIGMLFVSGIAFAQNEQSVAAAPSAAQLKLEQEFKQLILEMENGRMSRDKAVAERLLTAIFLHPRTAATAAGKLRRSKAGATPRRSNARLKHLPERSSR